MERNRLNDVLAFTQDKCQRQGEFIAELADWISSSLKNPQLNHKDFLQTVVNEISLYMDGEAQVLLLRTQEIKDADQ